MRGWSIHVKLVPPWSWSKGKPHLDAGIGGPRSVLPTNLVLIMSLHLCLKYMWQNAFKLQVFLISVRILLPARIIIQSPRIKELRTLGINNKINKNNSDLLLPFTEHLLCARHELLYSRYHWFGINQGCRVASSAPFHTQRMCCSVAQWGGYLPQARLHRKHQSWV